MNSGPPYICVVKTQNFDSRLKSWCGRGIPLSGEVTYELADALRRRNPITCPKCLSEVEIAATPPSTTPPPKLGCLEVALPFMGMGIFMFGVILGKPPSDYDFFLCIVPILCTSILVIMYGTHRVFKLSREAEKIGQENLAALLEKSPNRPCSKRPSGGIAGMTR